MVCRFGVRTYMAECRPSMLGITIMIWGSIPQNPYLGPFFLGGGLKGLRWQVEATRILVQDQDLSWDLWASGLRVQTSEPAIQ